MLDGAEPVCVLEGRATQGSQKKEHFLCHATAPLKIECGWEF